MKQFLKFFLALVVALVVVIAIRAIAFTIYSAPSSIGTRLKNGDKVMVNKLSRNHDFKRGELMVFTEKGEAPRLAIIEPPQSLGLVVAVPGDTITVNRQRYLIPYKCCDRCQCRDCRLYLVDTGLYRCLVHKHQVVGKAVKL